MSVRLRINVLIFVFLILTVTKAQCQDLRFLDTFLTHNVLNYEDVASYQKSKCITYRIDTLLLNNPKCIIGIISLDLTDFRICFFRNRMTGDIKILNYGKRGGESPVVANISNVLRKNRYIFNQFSTDSLTKFFLRLVFPEDICIFKSNTLYVGYKGCESNQTFLDKNTEEFVAYRVYGKHVFSVKFYLQNWQIRYIDKKDKDLMVDLIGTSDESVGVYPLLKRLPKSPNYLWH